MGLYVLQAKDDSSSAAAAIVAGGYAIDTLVQAVEDLGGKVHALVLTAGPHNLVGFVELPDEEAVIALHLVQSSLGRELQLSPAVPVSAWPTVVEQIGRITLPQWTSSGDDDLPEETNKDEARA